MATTTKNTGATKHPSNLSLASIIKGQTSLQNKASYILLFKELSYSQIPLVRVNLFVFSSKVMTDRFIARYPGQTAVRL